MTNPNLERLVDLAYSAAVDDALWRDWTVELVNEFGAPGALFWVIDSDRFEMCQNHMCFRDVDNAETAAEYLAGPVTNDPQMARVCNAWASEVYLDTDHIDPDDEQAEAYLAWQEARVGTRHHITSSVVLSDALKAGVSLHRTRSDGPAPEAVSRQVRALFPEFARALRLGFQHAEAVHEAWWEGFSGAAADARLLLGHDGRVLRFNASVERIFNRGDGLSIEQGRLKCLDPASEDKLAHAVDRACRPRLGLGASVALRRTGGRSPYLVSVYPLVQRHRFLAPYGATALLCITDPVGQLRALTEQQAEMLDLTPRETAVADLLLMGHSLESTAETLGMAYNTARVHLRALFRKTNTSRQAELVMFLERLA